MHPSVEWAMRSPGAVLHNMLWRLASDRSDRRFLFVFGAPRSGTTLLQTCLAAHPQFFSVDGELTLFSFGQDIFRRDRFADYLPDETLDEIYGRARTIAQFADLLYGALTDGAKDCVCVEKLPPHRHMARYISRLFPRARIVGIIRDGRDAYCSAQSHDHVRRTLGRDAARFARAWSRRAELTLQLDGMPNATLIRYEDFVRNPRGALAGVMSFADAAFSESQLSPLARQADRRVGEKAFAKLGGAIDAGSVSRWRREMDVESVRAFERAAGATLRHAGYPLSTDAGTPGRRRAGRQPIRSVPIALPGWHASGQVPPSGG